MGVTRQLRRSRGRPASHGKQRGGVGTSELHRMIQASSDSGAVICCCDLASAIPIEVWATSELQASSLLLSPACASFDQHQDFEARGDHFRNLMQSHIRVA